MAEEPRLKVSLNRRKQLEQDLAHVTQEMYKRNLELAQTNRVLSLLRTIDNLALESHESLESLTDAISQAIVDNSDFPLVTLLTKQDGQTELKVSGVGANATLREAADPTTLKNLTLNMNVSWLKGEGRAQLLQVGEMSEETLAKELGWSPQVLAAMRGNFPIASLYLVKLQARQRLVGALGVCVTSKIETMPPADVNLLDRLSEAIGLAIDSKMLFEENQRIVLQLQKTNQKLRELDQTKDDFISMASHQLRTPLTSVKGYVSMVLEGDAGEVSQKQKDLLSQAFVSSQRMVYLIADLLNVSRLRTGKFIIEAKPVNLADIVEGEISQLVETARGRNLELNYQKPANFPTLMLDDTKIRQVIMNFTDNAIHYTPAGGHIKVGLEDTGDMVEFTVTDDGIGVPKEEQHHLFNKFYRADNAKKARPDGTGLGLFMAKKVVIAQGGSIIFHSEVGKGSTFGFSFAKKPLLPENYKPQDQSKVDIEKDEDEDTEK